MLFKVKNFGVRRQVLKIHPKSVLLPMVVFSKFTDVKSGVSHGSVMGCLLFIFILSVYGIESPLK